MKNDVIKGYKVFNPDWTCRNKQYSCPGMFEEEGEIEVRGHGMHFCLNLADCFNHYQFNPENHVAEVIAYGLITRNGDELYTDKLEIVSELSWQEVLERVNTGKNCTGKGNTGDCNTGDCNTGNYNTGYYNTGNKNTGHYNVGNKNTGNKNTGIKNTGDFNTGDCNTGDYNAGDWNKSSFNTGCFMTEEQKIMLFNKQSDWTYHDWLRSDARYLLKQIPKNVVEWVRSSDMTVKERSEHPEHETTGGYLKVLDKAECGQNWWNRLFEYERNIIKALPNFDADIFEECTGIRV